MHKEKITGVLKEFVILNNGTNRWSLAEELDDFSFLFATQVPGFGIAPKDSYGGEGKGEDYWYVLSITEKETDKKVYVQFSGFYTSYDGVDWGNGDFTIVEPVEVKKIEWKEVES